ncbi:MAG: hypothetical protein LBR80_07465 [Deltaproteobacteria bacterium]|jgi:hypothetical protein|nr:hypothetical protein [Deltaproteobacteria bacterium]
MVYTRLAPDALFLNRAKDLAVACGVPPKAFEGTEPSGAFAGAVRAQA